MKNPALFDGGIGHSRIPFWKAHVWPLAAAMTMTLAVCLPATAQPPGVLWSTNIHAQVFAVDNQTNVYADAGGIIITLNGAGVPVQTNVLTTHPGAAARDASGYFYYSAAYSTQQVQLTPFTGFLAKYSSSGILVWQTNFISGTYRSVSITDVQVDPDGNAYAGWGFNIDTLNSYANLTHFDAVGNVQWTAGLGMGALGNGGENVQIGGVTETNGYAISYLVPTTFYGPDNDRATLSSFTSSGTASGIANWSTTDVGNTHARPGVDPSGNLYNAEGYSAQELTRRDATGAIVWQQYIGSNQRVLSADFYDGPHVADATGNLARYDSFGELVWTTNLASPLQRMVIDSSGNRFVSLADGSVVRLGAEAQVGASITNGLQDATVFIGTPVVLNVGVSGSLPVINFWYHDSTEISNGPGVSLNLGPVTLNQGGYYSVVASNAFGIQSNGPALLRVKQVELYLGNQLLTNGTYTFATNPVLSVHSAFSNGSAFYRLDGSRASFSDTYYSGPFTLTQSATVSAIGYSADFSQSEDADPVTIIVLTQHQLATGSSGGGSVMLSPPGGSYVSTQMVTVTAVPAGAGWQFLGWQGDAAGTNPAVSLTMDRDKSAYAVFGTTLSNTVTGNGQIIMDPPGGLYAYGTTVRLTAVPQPGSYFGFWGNAATGNTNPLYFTVTNPAPTVSSIFGSTPANQSSLTVMITGRGRVNESPQGNVFPTSQSVTLTAVPDPGQSFLGWGGDATGTQNPLSVAMNQNRSVTASFTAYQSLRVDAARLDGLGAGGFRFTVSGDLGTVSPVYGSSNMISWQLIGWVTNLIGDTSFSDSNAPAAGLRFYRTGP